MSTTLPTIMMDPAPSPDVIVHFVHGTFPRGMLRQLVWNARYAIRWLRALGNPKDTLDLDPPPHRSPQKRYWFEPDSPFERDIRDRLGTSHHLVRFERFLWSGNNSFEARKEASERLRAHLARSCRQYANARQLVLAHSHGGTAAVTAVDASESPHRLADGVMTLGTPFVRLVFRAAHGKTSEFKTAVAISLPIMLLLMAPLLALDVLLRGPGVAAVVSGWALLLLALITLGLRHVALAAIILLVICVFGGNAVRSDVLPAGLVAFFVTIFLAMRLKIPLALWSATRFAQAQAIQLPCQLIAVRVPNDEASLVIGLAQTVERLFHLAARPIRASAGWMARPLEWFGGTGWLHSVLNFFVIVVYLLVFGLAVLVVNDWIRGIHERRWWEMLLLAFGSPGMVLLPIGVTFLLIWLIPALALSLAAGREAFAIPALTGVDAEPLPFAHPEAAMRLVIDVEAAQHAQALGLNHSLHEIEAIRARIADWIVDFLPLSTEIDAGEHRQEIE